MKKIIILLMTATAIFSQSFHTISLDGENDFSSSETITTSTTGYSAYITWDQNNLYLGYSGSDIGSSESDKKWIVFYFDTDPAKDPTATNDKGTSAAVGFNTQNWTLPFNADYMLQIRTDEGFNSFRHYSSGSWGNDSSSALTFYDNDASNYIEVTIPRSKLGSPKQINALGYFINETSGGEYSYAAFPEGTITDGYYSSGNFSRFANYYLIAQVYQNISNHINNYEWLAHLKASTTSLSDTNIYAGMGLNSTDDFDQGVDIAKPPAPMSNYLEVFFNQSDWTSSLGPRFTRNIKKYISLDSTTSIWDFKIKTDLTATGVTVSVNDFDFVPGNYDIKLYDAVTDSTHNIRASGDYVYTSATSAEERNFKLIIGVTLTSPNISSDKSSIDFGSVKTNATASANITLSNSGDSTLIISNIISTDSAFPFNGTTAYNIASNNSQSISISFSPSVAGSYSGELLVLSNDPDTDTLIINLSGTGVALKPVISLSSSALNFDSVKVDYDSSISFKIYNTGDTTLSVSGIQISGNNFSFVGPTSFSISPNDSTERNIKFTPSGLSQYSDSLLIFNNDTNNDTLSVSLKGFGKEVVLSKTFGKGWRLISLPVIQNDNSAYSVIGDDISQYLLLSYDPAAGYQTVDTLSPGRGYWLGIESAAVIDVKGIPLIDSLLITLNNGWNLLADPYVRKYAGSSVFFKNNGEWVNSQAAVDSGWIQDKYYTYNDADSSYAAADTLSQWEGNWFLSLRQNISALFQHGKTTGSPLNKSKREEPKADWNNWQITIKAENNFGAKDNLLKFGVNENATDGFDNAFDLAKPPLSPASGSIYTYFFHDDWTQNVTKFAYDIKDPNEYTNLNLWSFYLKNSKAGTITLSWDNIENEFPIDQSGGFKLLLYGDNFPGEVNMLETKSVTFDAPGNSISEFIINPLFVSVRESDIPLIFSLKQNYPNPFNPATKIEYTVPSGQKRFVKLTVYNILGETVAILVNEMKSSGNYSAVFDASYLPSGVYFYKLKMGDFEAVKKMTLLK